MIKTISAYKPFTGGSTYGMAIIRLAHKSEHSINKYCFENGTGKIFFNLASDPQVTGMQLLEALKDKHLSYLHKITELKCNGKCKPTVMQYDQNCPIHGWVEE